MSHFLLGLEEGGTLMLIGMGVVLLFLCTLIFAMSIMSKIVIRLNEIFPEAVPEVKSKSSKSVNSIDDTIVAAIAAAIARKRA
ncbi:OadG family protein [bacterium]|nr:OadG family protein [bacterium]